MQQKLGVSYTQHELELIYRLYQYRKKYKTDGSKQSQLNQVFTYFANQQVSNAETLLNSIVGGTTMPQYNRRLQVQLTSKINGSTHSHMRITAR